MEQELPLLVVATRNAHKTGEIRAMLAGKWEVKDLSDYPQAPPVDETGVTFTENATLKALSASKCIPGVLLADDSGLEVDVLDGRPGVWSSSFGGEEGRKVFGRLFGQDAERLETVVAQNGDGRAERCDGVAVRPHVHCHENSLRGAERGEKRGVHHFSSSSSRRMLRTRSPSSRLRSAVKRRTGVYLSTIVFAMRF